MKEDKPFNAPFSRLKGLKLSGKKKPEPKPKKTPEEQPQTDRKGVEDECFLFSDAMDGVKPLPNDRVAVEPVSQESISSQVLKKARMQDREVMDALTALVSGKTRFDITCTGEYLEGHVVSIDPRVLKQLKSGELTIQAHLDLHGHVKEEAKTALMNFIRNCHALGYRTLLIIHGRGLKSDAGPVLKESVVHWLTTGTLSHLVLAFCSARPCDGGTGALYVLLKKRPVKSKWKRPL
ncbi:MAG TPA: Smr/MutS family protein [Desulfomonilia bacterium]|nr:Smr/MutS family protein [Desulfomonilia bacterium]